MEFLFFKRGGGKNFLALIIGLILSFIILEVVLRFYNPFQFRTRGNKIILPTNVNLEFQNKDIKGLDSIIFLSKNSIGFRGPELPKNQGEWLKIITVGGSTTECMFISDGKDWGSILLEKLKKKNDVAWLNNAGLDGHSTFGHQILLEDYLLPLKPDFLLFLVGANDVGRDDLNYFDNIFLNENLRFKDILIRKSEFLSLVQNFRRSLKAKRLGLSHTGVNVETLDTFQKIDDELVNREKRLHNKLVGNYYNRLKAIIKTTKKHNITPILITQPTVVGQGFDEKTGIDLEKIKYCHPLGGKAYWQILEMYNNITRRIAKEDNILLIDLARKMPKSFDLFYDCIHFKNEGAKKVADIIFNDLEKELVNLRNYPF